MKIFQRVLSGCAVLLLSSSALAQITLYEHEDFRGRSIFIDGPEPNLKELHFNDLASALVVERGAWEICHDANFRGRCYVLERGEYRWMRDLDFNDKISSVRPVDARRHSMRAAMVATMARLGRNAHRIQGASGVSMRSMS